MNLTTKAAKHAKGELDILKQFEEKHIAILFEEEIISICEKFGKMENSVESINYYATGIGTIISTLCLQKPISPITGEDWEWQDLSIDNPELPFFVNKRDNRIFKNRDGLSWFTEAIIFNGDKTGAFVSKSSVDSQSGESFSSTLYIKSFPFLPKSFMISVKQTEWLDKEQTEEKEGGGWWSSIIVDDNHLAPALEYYSKSSLII